MKALAVGVAIVGTLLVVPPSDDISRYHRVADQDLVRRAAPSRAISRARELLPDPSSETLTEVVQRNCVVCHNDQLMTGNLSLQEFDVAKAPEMAETAEKMIGKLRLGMMPPPGIPRPGGDTLTTLVETLETLIDEATASRTDPGRRTFQRLNRAEYAQAVYEILGLEVDPDVYLPPDTKSENFDNIADAQIPSATVMDSYLNAASEISRLAVGDPNATTQQVTYSVHRTVSQIVHIEDTPRGTRGGLSVLHTFPADGEYTFTASFYTSLAGYFFGKYVRGEQLELSIDGERVAMIEVDRFLAESEPTGVTRGTGPVHLTAGQHRVSAAFIKTFEGPADDVVTPIRRSFSDPEAVYNDGQTHLPHLRDLQIQGPLKVTGVSDTPTRRRVFSCRPTVSSEERPCATEIVSRLATKAYRRPATDRDIADLISLYEDGTANGGFEAGIRMGLQGILSSVHFLFRLEEVQADPASTESYRVSDVDLASRLSFFLWGAPPDDELIDLALEGKLSDPIAMERQVRRMLQDPRSTALSTRFAAQWLRLQDLNKVEPGDDWPNFDQTLKDAMLRETELFFNSVVQEDRSVLDLLTADYTFLNATLARHYRIPNVAGSAFQCVELPNGRRRGLLGHGSILVQTSHGDRTSPVLRGKWIMEVLLDSPPPPPPPNVPSFEQTEEVDQGRPRTVKERMQLHRANPVCQACHQYIDPLGLALENFDVTAEWRIKDAGNSVDPSGMLWDGTLLNGPEDLRQALLKYRTSFLRTFTKNLLAYAIGRRVEYYDQPTIRAITQRAAENDYRMSSFVVDVAKSAPFQRTQAPRVSTNGEPEYELR